MTGGAWFDMGSEFLKVQLYDTDADDFKLL